ncbi:hypothetical protein [Amycolatopsis sp. WGS_07]|uniref:hypothetical protein n=1 Tax=Amycolatopsis sp. WGS_07 TaxID=3076764 RepID=UPI0038739C78
MIRSSKDTPRSRVAAINLELDCAAPPAADLDRISEWSALLARRISVAGPARRQQLLFHHVRMTLDRLGYLPRKRHCSGSWRRRASDANSTDSAVVPGQNREIRIWPRRLGLPGRRAR